MSNRPFAAVWTVGDTNYWLVAETPLEVTALADEALAHGRRWVEVTLASPARSPATAGRPLRVLAAAIVAVGPPDDDDLDEDLDDDDDDD